MVKAGSVMGDQIAKIGGEGKGSAGKAWGNIPNDGFALRKWEACQALALPLHLQPL
jgi:hypothetical protein